MNLLTTLLPFQQATEFTDTSEKGKLKLTFNGKIKISRIPISRLRMSR